MNDSAEKRKELEEKLKNMSPDEIMELQKKQCIFCQIISDKIPSKKIYEDNFCLAILDINPAAKGHLLLMPKEHYAIFPQIPEEVTSHLFKVVKKLSTVLLRALSVKGTTTFIANGLAGGQKAQHVMIHLIPRKENDGLFLVEEKVISKDLLLKVKQALQPKVDLVLGLKEKEGIEKKEEEEGIFKNQEEPEQEVEDHSQEPEESDKSEEETEENTSLDDIANLFK